ncbi:MAG: DUF255 domain-containing protein [Bacteroidales bacterium]|nr:DUF255 domain-containing protein [Bacteroidales bacterium]
MKKQSLFILSLTLLFALCGFSQTKVNWTDVNKAVSLSEKKDKPIFIDCYTSWCGWCKVLDEKTFSNDTIAGILNYYYYPVKFDAEGQEDITIKGHVYHAIKNPNGKKGTHELMKYLWEGQQGGGYPSLVIRKGDFSPITVEMGYRTPDNLEPILIYFAEGYNKKMSFEKFEKNYVKDYRKSVLKKIF